MDVKKELLEAVYRHVNAPGLFNDMLDKVLEPVLNKLVADTSTPIDDVLKAALYPHLSTLLKEEAKKVWEGVVA